jgi:hypothetical protein
VAVSLQTAACAVGRKLTFDMCGLSEVTIPLLCIPRCVAGKVGPVHSRSCRRLSSGKATPTSDSH